MSLRCVGFIPQVVHRGGAAEEDGLEGRSGCRPSCEEESSPTADGYVRGFTSAALKASGLPALLIWSCDLLLLHLFFCLLLTDGGSRVYGCVLPPAGSEDSQVGETSETCLIHTEMSGLETENVVTETQFVLQVNKDLGSDLEL